MQAAVSVGATVGSGTSVEKPVAFALPIDEKSYSSRHFHPLRRDRISNFIAEGSLRINATHGKITKKDAIPVGKLFAIDISQIVLRPTDDSETKMKQDGGSWDVESQSALPTTNEDKALAESSGRKIQKWTKEEKRIFLSAFQQHGAIDVHNFPFWPCLNFQFAI